jgi:hypothetical protein
MKWNNRSIYVGLALVASCLLCCKRADGDPKPKEERIQYEISNTAFANPERGFIRTMSVKSDGVALTGTQLSLLRSQHVSMILRVIYFDKFKDKDISADFLSLIESDLNTARNAGLKMILRFAYTDDMAGTDAPLAIIERHLDQLKPVFENHKDVISFVQAGFIGAWGEWHSSSNGLATVANERAVLNKLLSVLPMDILVQVRTPGAKQQIFNSTAALTASQAYSSENIARVGHHNDCFLSGGTDYGTYTNIEQEKQYISNEALYVPTGGETCPPTGGYDPTCAEGRREMRLLKWTYLNLDWYPATINAWKNSGCFEEFQNNLGYRLALVDALFPKEAVVGGNMAVDLNIINNGYAPLYYKKKTMLVLKNTTTGTYYDIPLSIDLRLCKPTVTIPVKETVSLAGLPAGTYELFLRIADQHPSLEARAEYAVRLANTGSWLEEHNGINKLNTQILIK